MAGRKGRAVKAAERGAHDALHAMLLSRHVEAWWHDERQGGWMVQNGELAGPMTPKELVGWVREHAPTTPEAIVARVQYPLHTDGPARRAAALAAMSRAGTP